MDRNNNRLEIHERLTRIETHYEGIKGDILEIKDNHLPTIEKAIESLNKRLMWFGTLVITTLVAIILNLIKG